MGRIMPFECEHGITVDGGDFCESEICVECECGKAISAEQVAAEAYQVIGCLADTAGLFEHKEVVRALDYFSAVAAGKTVEDEILPWGSCFDKQPNPTP